MPDAASCGSIGLAGPDEVAPASSRSAGGTVASDPDGLAVDAASASSRGAGGSAASDFDGMALNASGSSPGAGGTAAKEPCTGPHMTLRAAAASSPGLDETPVKETGSDPSEAPSIAEIGGRESCELGAPNKLNARLNPLKARASAMKLMPTTSDVIPSFVPENALPCLPILSFMSTAVDRLVARSEYSTG
jgi:hypothetical protein